MKVLAILGIYLMIAQALQMDELNSAWELYKKQYDKVYELEEDVRRFTIFVENLKKIGEHNEKYIRDELSYKVAINQFADMEEDEVNAMLNGYKEYPKKSGIPYIDDGKEAAATVDWRNKGVVTAVKDQGHCGSCWAFSTTGSLEGQHALKTGKLVSLSEQNLVDCAVDIYEDFGCFGGLPATAFDYIKANGGIDTEKSYPYTAENGTCSFKKSNVGATVTGYVDLPSGDENALQNAVSKVGPISVLIDAGSWSFGQYSAGIFNEPSCNSTLLDHAVLVVGYGTENNLDYWLVKNSWGTTWGDQGYIKMIRNANNQCGIATSALYPTV